MIRLNKLLYGCGVAVGSFLLCAASSDAYPGDQSSDGIWSPVAEVGAPAPRTGASAVWTGTEVIVWGGLNASTGAPCGGLLCGDGGAYDPASASWQTVPPSSARAQHSAVWSGDEMLVFGGQRTTSYLVGGAAFSPDSSQWRDLPVTNAPSARARHVAAWTGASMLIWGGIGCPQSYCGDGAAYIPATDTWRAIQPAGAPSARFDAAAVWTGSELLVWGGSGGASGGLLADGGAYSPDADAWRPLSTIGAPSARAGAISAWTGTEMVVWGGNCGQPQGLCADGAAYNPSTTTWRPLSRDGAPSPRLLAAAVWTGSQLVLWGGEGCGPAGACGDGAEYSPTTDTWTQLPEAGAPAPRIQPAAIWTDFGTFVWGGYTADGTPLGDGAIFTPDGAQLPGSPTTPRPSK